MATKNYVICENDCLVEGMSKEQTLAAIEQATGVIVSGDEDVQFNMITNQNNGKGIKVWSGTRAEYNALEQPNVENVIYHITDDKTGAEAYEVAINAKGTVDEANEKMSLLMTDITEIKVVSALPEDAANYSKRLYLVLK